MVGGQVNHPHKDEERTHRTGAVHAVGVMPGGDFEYEEENGKLCDSRIVKNGAGKEKKRHRHGGGDEHGEKLDEETCVAVKLRRRQSQHIEEGRIGCPILHTEVRSHVPVIEGIARRRKAVNRVEVEGELREPLDLRKMVPEIGGRVVRKEDEHR